jgi:hypothetical protein
MLLASGYPSLPLAAQEAGPPEATSPPQAQTLKEASSGISTEPTSVPVDQIIQRFAEREAEFKTERDNFTYVQTFVVQTIDDDGRPDGEYRMKSDITFTPSGRRYENITYAPPPTLERVSLSEQDLADLKDIQPFVLLDVGENFDGHNSLQPWKVRTGACSCNRRDDSGGIPPTKVARSDGGGFGVLGVM